MCICLHHSCCSCALNVLQQTDRLGQEWKLGSHCKFFVFLNETETDLHILSYLTMALDMQIILVSFILRQSVSFLIQFRHRHNKTDKIQWKLVEVFSRFDGLSSICSCYVLWTTEIKKVLQNNPLHCTPVFALVLAQ